MPIQVPANFLSTFYPFLKDSNTKNMRFVEPKGEVRTSVFYMNDAHGAKLDRYKSAADSFTRTHGNNPSIDALKLSAGDINIGEDPKKNAMLIEAQNEIGLDLSTVGNHELDIGTKTLAEELGKAKFRYVSTNLVVDNKSEISPYTKNQKIVKSWIINKNGHNYGFIGGAPTDLLARVTDPRIVIGVNSKDFDSTIAELQQEVDKLRQKGINKIIMLSHMGYSVDLQVARKVSGIDVIIGGHSHDTIDGLKPETNIVHSSTGEPVVITQGGKDGDYFGILDLVFDSEGKIVSAGNKLNSTNDWPRDKTIQKIREKYLGKIYTIGKAANTYYPKNPQTEENPIANLFLDALKYKTGAPIAIVNSGGIRGGIDKGDMKNIDLIDLVPFVNKVCTTVLSEKDIIEALNVGAQSTLKVPCKPGVVQVSGLKYTIAKDKTVKNVFAQNPDGTYTQLNHTNPDPNKKFTVASVDFFLRGPEGFTMLVKPDTVTYDRTDIDDTIEYIKSFNNKPFEIKPQGRITIE